ncbi:hypothetical protein SAMN04487965_0489 [Microbulbifer donghaiensis]|uniref:ABM domain-containing protein n=1 Tax=Microbulbifer donghaiensis TaxID=494016 RepID=A0A1M4VRA7_9GAMM|nr:hypothetical protein [Microbulbifer donghaiensis]SHE71332.1 hypothetical protein SAMN04487965_0489 [Microbulbifer donghaiensis]
MYARITTYKVKPADYETIDKRIEVLTPEIMSIPGLKQWISCGDENGERVIIGIYKSKEDAEQATSKVKELFAKFEEFYDVAPTPHGYEVLRLESN